MGSTLNKCLSKALLALGVLFAMQHAHADMWTYVDARGVKHFASTQLDKRYRLMFKGQPAPETANVPATSTATVGVAPAYAPVGISGRSVASLALSPGLMAIKPYLRSAADANQLDMALLQAVIATESGFDPSAVSPKGAIGLMQVMPATAQRYGVASDHNGTIAAKLSDPRTNINTGARYLRDLIRLFPGQLELAVAAYNAGEGAVQKAGNRIPAYRETQNYVRSVMNLYHRLNAQAQPTGAQTQLGRVRGEFHGPRINDQTAMAGLASAELSTGYP
jgi:soluble lytic murein transglycosylase-like protein